MCVCGSVRACLCEGVTDRAPEREVSTAVHPVWGLVGIPCLKSPFAIRKHRLNLVNWSRGLGEVMGIESLAWESKGTPDPTRHCNSMPVRTLRGGGRYSRPCSMRRRLMRRRLKRRAAPRAAAPHEAAPQEAAPHEQGEGSPSWGIHSGDPMGNSGRSQLQNQRKCPTRDVRNDAFTPQEASGFLVGNMHMFPGHSGNLENLKP